MAEATTTEQAEDHRRRRPPDEAPWWDSFPWWGVIIGLVLFWMGYLIFFVDRYNEAWERIIPGLRLTIEATLWAFGIACAIGLVTGLGRVSNNFVFRNLARTYVEFIRGIPILVLLFTLALVVVPELSDSLPDGWPRPDFKWRAIIALALIYGGYIAEIFRGGIQSIPRGQMEAGRSLGLNRRLTMRTIILPQAMRAIIPPLGNDFIAILKDSSLLSVLGILEVTQLARQYASGSFKFRESYLVLTFIYLSLTLLLSLLLGVLERRMTRDRRDER
jgi:polar amino acid transport system permease protein